MAHVMELKDGRMVTVLQLKVALEIVEEYAGEEPRRYIEDYISEAEQDSLDFDAQEKYYGEQMERMEEHQRAVLNDVKEELEDVEQMLLAPRLDRKKLISAVKHIWKMVWAEL